MEEIKKEPTLKEKVDEIHSLLKPEVKDKKKVLKIAG